MGFTSHICKPSIWKPEAGEFKASLGYAVSSRPAWATMIPCFKNKIKQNNDDNG